MRKLRSEAPGSNYRREKDSYLRWSGALESPTSEMYIRWKNSLPVFLRAIIEEDLTAREAAAKQKSQSSSEREG